MDLCGITSFRPSRLFVYIWMSPLVPSIMDGMITKTEMKNTGVRIPDYRKFFSLGIAGLAALW